MKRQFFQVNCSAIPGFAICLTLICVLFYVSPPLSAQSTSSAPGERNRPERAGEALLVLAGSADVEQKDNATKHTLEPGDFIGAGRRIRTPRTGQLDFQTPRGSVFRASQGAVFELYSVKTNSLVIRLEEGALLVKVRGGERVSIVDFATRFNSTSADFRLAYDESGRMILRVYRGGVRLAPRFDSLRKFDSANVWRTSPLNRLASLSFRQKTYVAAGRQGRLNERSHNLVLKLNRTVAELYPDATPEILKDLKALKKIGARGQARLTKLSITLGERQTLAGLDGVDRLTFRRVRALRAKNQTAARELLRKARATLREKAEKKTADKTAEMAEKVKLKDAEDIKKQYGNLERLILSDGRRLEGRVVSQNEEEILFHTTKGVIRVKKELIVSMEYVD